MVRYTDKNRKRAVIVLLAAFMLVSILACLFLNRSIAHAEASDTRIQTHSAVDYDYSFDFTAYTSDADGASTAWKNHIYESDNMRLAPAAGYRSLTPYNAADNRPEVYGNDTPYTGYVIYQLKAPVGKVYSTFSMWIMGRSFHYGHTDLHDGCGFDVKISTNGTDWTAIQTAEGKEGNKRTFPPVSSGAQEVYSLTFKNAAYEGEPSHEAKLRELIKGQSSIFVQIEATGAATDWAAIEQLKFDGSFYYAGFEEIEISLKGGDLGETAKLGSTVTVREATKTPDAGTLSVSVSAPDGAPVAMNGNSFTCDALGKYLVKYTVDDGGRIYEKEYPVFCVEKQEKNGFVSGNYGKGTRKKDAFLTEGNYYVPTGSSLVKTAVNDIDEQNLSLEGEAYYLQPLSFTKKNFNFTFDIKKLQKGATFDFVISGAPGEVDFDTKAQAGVYFTLKYDGTRMILAASYSDGDKVVSLGQEDYSRFNTEGVHGIGFNRRVLTFTDGMSCFFDGSEFSSYYMCINVYLSKFMKDGQVYMGFRTTGDAEGEDDKVEVELLALAEGDTSNPTLCDTTNHASYQNYTEFCAVDGTFTLPTDCCMYDRKDGVMPYIVTVTDPNGNEIVKKQVLRSNLSEAVSFDVEYKGKYKIVYLASDYNGNNKQHTQTVESQIKAGAPDFKFSKKIEESGRVGKSVELYEPTVLVNGSQEAGNAILPNVIATITNPSGGKIVKRMVQNGDKWDLGSFTPFDLGVYTIIYSVSNEVGTIKQYFEIKAKANVDEDDSYELVTDAEYWVGTKGSVVQTDGGVQIMDSAFCKLPFEMTNGVEVTLDLTPLADKSKVDCWASIGIGANSVISGFGGGLNGMPGFVHFMLYYEKGTYYVNGDYVNGDGVQQGLFGPIEMGTTGIVTLGIEKLTGSTTYTDNVNIYLNHRRTDYGTETLVEFSSLVDDENFSYLSVLNYGNAPSETTNAFRSLIVREVSRCDQQAPVFLFDGKDCTDYQFATVKLGDTVTLPTITIEEDVDANFKYVIALYNPLGEEVDYRKGSFVAEMEGKYALVLRAYDKSGNVNYQIKEIVVEKGGWSVLAIVLTSVGGALLVAGGTLCGILIPKRRRARLESKGEEV